MEDTEIVDALIEQVGKAVTDPPVTRENLSEVIGVVFLTAEQQTNAARQLQERETALKEAIRALC